MTISISVSVLELVLRCPLVLHSRLLVCLHLLMRLVLIHRREMIGRKERWGRGPIRHLRREARVPGRVRMPKRRHMRGHVLIAVVVLVLVLVLELEMRLVALTSRPEGHRLRVHIGGCEMLEGYVW